MRLCDAAFGASWTLMTANVSAPSRSRGAAGRVRGIAAHEPFQPDAGQSSERDRCGRARRPYRRYRDGDAYRVDDPMPSRAVELGGVRTLLVRAAAQGRRAARRHHRLPPGGAAVHRQADRAVAELRGAGGHRDGERAADHRDARGAGAADRDRRGVAGHQFLARRPRAGVRRDAGKGDAAVRGGVRQLVDL